MALIVGRQPGNPLYGRAGGAVYHFNRPAGRRVTVCLPSQRPGADAETECVAGGDYQFWPIAAVYRAADRINPLYAAYHRHHLGQHSRRRADYYRRFSVFRAADRNALDEVDYGRIEAILSMGGNLWHVIFKSLLPEALPTLLAGITLTIVMLIGFSSMAGVIGGGGLGDLAIRYGYQRFNDQVMVGTVLILVVMVQGVQMIGDRLVRQLAHRR